MITPQPAQSAEGQKKDIGCIYRRSSAQVEEWTTTVCDGSDFWPFVLKINLLPPGRQYAVVPAGMQAYGVAWSNDASQSENITVQHLGLGYLAIYPTDPTRPAWADVEYEHARTGNKSRRITFDADEAGDL